MSWKESKGLAGGAAILAIAAIGFVIYHTMFKPIPQGERTLKCEKCEGIVKQQITTGTKFPVACEKCKTQTVWPTQPMRCMQCRGADGKNKQLMVVDKGDGKVHESKCPGCGGQLMP